MSLYGQEPETTLLGAFLSKLEHRSVIDVGAERGTFAAEMLRAGAETVHVLEPEPANVAALHERFDGEARVTLHAVAASDTDHPLELFVSTKPDGTPVSFGHTVLSRASTDEIAWSSTVTVEARSLRSLVESGELPRRVGILKVDTEGHDDAVLAGMGDLDCDVVMVEHWVDLPHSLGPCPWTLEQIASPLRTRGFSRYAVIQHRAEFVILTWDDGEIPAGHMGNVVFLHDRVVDRLLPDVLTCASQLALGAVQVGEMYATAAVERLAVIEEREQIELKLREQLDEIEQRFREDAFDRNREQLPEGSRYLWRIRGLAVPKIGRLRHYLPRALRVPQAYVRTAAPPDPPRISIVTPSFQQGRYVERTIFSVVNQQYPNLEYVVQDGGSTDETLEILQRFDGKLTSWVSEPDVGQADAINRGFSRTTGEIMAWLNSDDLLLPGALAYVGRYFASHPDVDVVYGNRRLIDENDGEIGIWVLPEHDDLMLTNVDYVPQETVFWRRRIWESAGGRIDPGFDYAMDWDLLLRFREAGAKIVRLPRFLGAFRVHDEQKTTAHDKVGAAECARLRERVHGRPVSHEEAVGQTVSYLRRHLLVHARQRLAERFSQPEVDVVTVPPPVDPARPKSLGAAQMESDR